MMAEQKILRLVEPENGGPRKRNILDGLARRYGEGSHLIDYLIAGGKLKASGGPRNRTYGLPKRRRSAA